MSTPTEIIKFLQNYNAWRRGDETLEMPHPAEIGKNIQDAIVLLREYKKLTTRAERAEKIILVREATIADFQKKLESETARANEFDAVLGEIKQALDEMGAPVAEAIGCRLLVSSETVKKLAKFTHPLAETEEDK